MQHTGSHSFLTQQHSYMCSLRAYFKALKCVISEAASLGDHYTEKHFLLLFFFLFIFLSFFCSNACLLSASCHWELKLLLSSQRFHTNFDTGNVKLENTSTTSHTGLESREHLYCHISIASGNHQSLLTGCQIVAGNCWNYLILHWKTSCDCFALWQVAMVTYSLRGRHWLVCKLSQTTNKRQKNCKNL